MYSHTHGLQPCPPSRVGMNVFTLFFVSVSFIYFSSGPDVSQQRFIKSVRLCCTFCDKRNFWGKSSLVLRFPCSVCGDARSTKSFNNHHKAIHEQGCHRTFFKCDLPICFSYNGDFVVFLMQWEPNGDQISPVKLKNGDLWLLNCKICAGLDSWK